MAPAAHSPAEAPVEPSPTTLQERRKQVESVRAPEASADALEPKATLETTKNWVEAIPTILHSFQKKESDLIDALAIPRCAPCQRRRDGGLQRLADQKCLEKNCILRGVPVCSKCFDTFHTTPEQLQHPQTCQLERVVYYCAECDLSFCTACFDAIHSIPKLNLSAFCK
uniref:B box-type domain-containing protein n=1 Tax=Globisporangium ultimum (strain ATCC 200006 / CBS 805.95 / DAOM BR144) TaxID=431595 RepID=K3WRC0_GLOUD